MLIRKEALLILNQLRKDVIERHNDFRIQKHFDVSGKPALIDSATNAIYIISKRYEYKLKSPLEFTFNYLEAWYLHFIIRRYRKKFINNERIAQCNKIKDWVEETSKITYERNKKILKDGL